MKAILESIRQRMDSDEPEDQALVPEGTANPNVKHRIAVTREERSD